MAVKLFGESGVVILNVLSNIISLLFVYVPLKVIALLGAFVLALESINAGLPLDATIVVPATNSTDILLLPYSLFKPTEPPLV